MLCKVPDAFFKHQSSYLPSTPLPSASLTSVALTLFKMLVQRWKKKSHTLSIKEFCGIQRNNTHPPFLDFFFFLCNSYSTTNWNCLLVESLDKEYPLSSNLTSLAWYSFAKLLFWIFSVKVRSGIRKWPWASEKGQIQSGEIKPEFTH